MNASERKGEKEKTHLSLIVLFHCETQRARTLQAAGEPRSPESRDDGGGRLQSYRNDCSAMFPRVCISRGRRRDASTRERTSTPLITFELLVLFFLFLFSYFGFPFSFFFSQHGVRGTRTENRWRMTETRHDAHDSLLSTKEEKEGAR